LKASYPSNLLAAYLDGEFVNLTAGSVYPEFDRTKNASTETIQAKEALHVGMDFNVGRMSAVMHVQGGDDPHAVAELTGVLDTPAMVSLLVRRYKDAGHRIIVYPDASGNSRKSNNASESDLSLLRTAGFTVSVNPLNPAIKDRVLSMNGMIHKEGQRRYRVNPQHCPPLVESLEKQAYEKNGEPDKASGLDHIVDAAGYFIAYRYPIVKWSVVWERRGFNSFPYTFKGINMAKQYIICVAVEIVLQINISLKGGHDRLDAYRTLFASTMKVATKGFFLKVKKLLAIPSIPA
jgi:hypothetical protein